MNDIATQDNQYLSTNNPSTIDNLAQFKAKHGLGFKDLGFMFNLSIDEVRTLDAQKQSDCRLLSKLQQLDCVLDRYKSVKDIFTDIDAQQALKTISNQAKEIKKLNEIIKNLQGSVKSLNPDVMLSPYGSILILSTREPLFIKGDS